MKNAPLLSVCIPAYNRAAVLDELLQSVLSQDFRDFEIVVCEDASPERDAIRAIIEALPRAMRARIRYFENETNLGYDGNLRTIIGKAEGDYCVLMGNDDVMCPGALKTVAAGLSRHPSVGVVLRTYASFDDTPAVINQVFRYFEYERVFEPGPDSIVTFFRRSVVLPGMVLRRSSAIAYATDEFDGTLQYQLYLVGRIMEVERGLSLPEIITLYRNGGVPDFGNSAVERGRFVPGANGPGASIYYMESMLRIARTLEKRCGAGIYQPIVRDLSNYSYPFIAMQSAQRPRVFGRYCWQLARLGFGRYPLFYVYVLSLVILGRHRVEGIIRYLKHRMGRTPEMGRLYRGHVV